MGIHKSSEEELMCNVCGLKPGTKSVCFLYRDKRRKIKLCSACKSRYFSPDGYLRFGKTLENLFEN
jgi:hypothetical protein